MHVMMEDHNDDCACLELSVRVEALLLYKYKTQ